MAEFEPPPSMEEVGGANSNGSWPVTPVRVGHPLDGETTPHAIGAGNRNQRNSKRPWWAELLRHGRRYMGKCGGQR